MDDLEAIADGFPTNGVVLHGLTTDLPPEAATRSYHGANPALWLVGHVALGRRELLRLLGESPVAASWEGAFARGSSAEPRDDWPDLATVVEDFDAHGLAIAEALRAMPAEARGRAARHVVLDQPATTLHNIQFLFFHESYHLGQLGWVRRFAGLPGIA